MAIQNRRGNYEKLNVSKLLPGEYAIVLQNDPHCTDGKAAYICFQAGDVKRLSTYEDMQELIDEKTQDIVDNLTEEIDAVIIIANTAIKNADEATVFATAVGEDLIARRDAGEFNGEKGADGVITDIQNGRIAFQIDDGNLFLYYEDGDTPPECKIDTEGHLVITVGGAENGSN